ncbi:MAG: hypothetical protein F6K30_12355 [Cyanothece sp. SIO2G6]|nr:hypothetical protein [Cyanothece sp. SIO2G6]
MTIATPITTEISTAVLTYNPEIAPAQFEVTVRNQSSDFAAFRVELLAAGGEQNSSSHWYRLAPDVSSKIPGGDRTQFQIEIVDIPPVSGGFTGTMNITVRVFSIELGAEDRQVLRLVIPGTGYLPPQLTLVVPKLQGYPNATTNIPITVTNPNRQAIDVVVRLSGLPTAWLPNGAEQHIHLLEKSTAELFFICQLPSPPVAPSQEYPFTLAASQTQASIPAYAHGVFTVMPAGYVALRCDPMRQTIPENPRRWLNPRKGKAVIDLILDNQSNLPHQAQLHAAYPQVVQAAPPSRRWRWPWRRRSPDSDEKDAPTPKTVTLDPSLTLSAQETALPLDNPVLQTLTIERRLPWLGRSRFKSIEVQAKLTPPRIDLRNDTETIYVEILPVVPVWLQTVVGLLLLAIAGFVWWQMNQSRHFGPVTSVQFNGQADEVVSVAKDGRIRRWQIEDDTPFDLILRRRLRVHGILNRGDDRSIRVVRYRPVDNDQVAVGFENGEIATWNLLLRHPLLTMSLGNDDRVFDLAIAPDAQSIYSGHGSGAVVQWNLQPNGLLPPGEPIQGFVFDFAVQALSLLGDRRQSLAIGGRFNRLFLLNVTTGASQELNYRNGGADDYILSMDSPSDRPNLLAVADNQGYISLWDLQSCLADNLTACELIDEWSSGHNGAVVRAIAFSVDGCFLASSGDDGQIKLWPLTSRGQRLPSLAEGQQIQQFTTSINAVDLVRTRRHLMIASGAESGYVRLHRIRLNALPEDNLTCSRIQANANR